MNRKRNPCKYCGQERRKSNWRINKTCGSPDCKKLLRIDAKILSKKLRTTALKNGYGKWMKGKHLTEITKEKMRLSATGKKRPWVIGFHGKHTDISKEKMRMAKLGKKHSEERRRKKSAVMPKGSSHYAWKGGTTEIKKIIRHSLEYRLWREAVFKRDNYTCRFCGKRGGDLEADHIKPFAYFPELRFSIDNGRTLCRRCHRITPTFGNNKLEPLP